MGTGGHQTPQILHSLVLKQLLSTKWWRNVFNSKLAELQFIQQQRLQCFVNAGEGRRLPVRTSRSLLPVSLLKAIACRLYFSLVSAFLGFFARHCFLILETTIDLTGT